jgi:tetratricopeptide (TPR) repeat protein
MPRLPRIAVVIIGSTVACSPAPSDPKSPPAAAQDNSTGPTSDGPTGEPGDPSAEATAWHQAIDELDHQIAAYTDWAAELPDDWTRQEVLAASWIQRARLTGSYDDYTVAQTILDEAVAMAPEGSGPLLTRARLHITLHRLDAAEADLGLADAAAFQPSGVPEQILAMRGDIAWQRGELDLSRELRREAEATASSVSGQAGLIADRWHRGDVQGADADWLALQESISTVQASMRSWVELQRGIIDLEYDRWDEAGAHFAEADALFGGHWLNREHQAEVLTLQGQTEQAVEIYLEVIDQTDSPEFMDALADIREEQGDQEAADGLRAEARARYTDQLARFPEAAAGHALDHLLAHGTAEEALALALTNAALRPYVPAQLQLVQAWLKAGEVEEAAATLEAVRETEWVSPEVHELAAEVAEAQGDAAGAAAEREAAETLRTTAFSD